MCHNRQVENRARCIEDGEAREMFCRSMGGHWSVQHKKFFRFPEKEVRKEANGNWIEVEFTEEFNEQYGKYNHALVGRALFLSKLEEAAKVRSNLPILDGIPYTEQRVQDLARNFDKNMKEVLFEWRTFLLEREGKGHPQWFTMQDDDHGIDLLVQRVDAHLRAYHGEDVDFSSKKKMKRKMEDEDDHSPETKRQFQRVDMEMMEITSRQLSVQESPGAQTRRASARLMAKERPTRFSDEGTSCAKK
jgi:hypothetical protein